MKKIKITAVCSNGLGTGLLISINIKAVLSKLDYKGVEFEVNNIDLSSVASSNADLYVMGVDVSNSCEVPNKIILNNLIDKVELENKLVEWSINNDI